MTQDAGFMLTSHARHSAQGRSQAHQHAAVRFDVCHNGSLRTREQMWAGPHQAAGRGETRGAGARAASYVHALEGLHVPSSQAFRKTCGVCVSLMRWQVHGPGTAPGTQREAAKCALCSTLLISGAKNLICRSLALDCHATTTRGSHDAPLFVLHSQRWQIRAGFTTLTPRC